MKKIFRKTLILVFEVIDRDGSGPDPARPEAQPMGVLGDPDPSRAIFGGPGVDPRHFYLAPAIFFSLNMLI